MNHYDVAHAWAHDNYNRNGEIKGLNVFATEHNRAIYSYGTHFMVARKTGDPTFPMLFTTRGYSVSTSKHISYIGRAISHYSNIFYCHDPAGEPLTIYRHEMDIAMGHRLREWASFGKRIEELKERIAKRAERGDPPSEQLDTRLDDWQKTLENEAGSISERAKELERFRKSFEVKVNSVSRSIQRLRLKLLKNEWHGHANRIDAMEERARKKTERDQAARAKLLREQEKESLEKWLAGDTNIQLRYQGNPARLRVIDSEVQTTGGARIPVTDALKLWRLVNVCRTRKEDHRPERRTFMLAHYPLDAVTKTGSVVIGCHRIDYGEMERIHPQVVEAAKETLVP